MNHPPGANREVLKTAKGEKVKGKMVRAHLDFARETLAPGRARSANLSELWAKVKPETRAALERGILEGTWYDFETLIDLDRAIDQSFSSKTPEVIEKLGEYSAVHNVPQTAVTGDLHRFFRISTQFHDTFQNYGTSEYKQINDFEGEMIYREYTVYSPLFCRSAVGFFRKVIDRFGYDQVEVRERECHCAGQKSCTFLLKWRKPLKK